MENKLDGFKELNKKSNKEFEAFFISVLPYMLSAKDMKYIMQSDTNKKFFIKKFKNTFHNIDNDPSNKIIYMRVKKSPNHQRRYKQMKEIDSIAES